MKRIVSLLLGVLLLAGTMNSIAGCSASIEPNALSNQNFPTTKQTNSTSELVLWTMNSAEKTKQKMEAIDSSSKTINLAMAKGESEGGQVMLTASKDVVVKNVKVSRLTNGYSYIPTDSVEIFWCDYIELTNEYNGVDDFNIGDFVSDAIFPFKTSVEYGFNTISNGDTQSIYIEVTTPASTVAGTYSANITVETNRDVYTVPFTVTVWNYDISQLTLMSETCMTDFRARFSVGEMDSSDQMATYYFEAGLKYGMSSSLPFDGTGGTERYIELLRKYYNHPKFTSYRLYYETIQGGFNVNLFAEYLVAIGKASIEDNANYFTKAITYFSNIVDEPYMEEHFNNLSKNVAQLKSAEEIAITQLNELYGGSKHASYVTTVLEPSIRSIRNVLPISTENSVRRVEDMVELTTCPALQFYDTEAQRESINNFVAEHEIQKTKWSYTCLAPKYPYPNNHLDDYNLNFRVMGWMLNRYDIEGYLNWCVVLNSCAYGENPYEKDDRVGEYSMTATTDCPGDGFMFYPGRPYGINGPVASLRAVAFRDGVEDYESINALKKVYEEKGISSDNILESFYNRLMSGTMSTATQSVFDDVRISLGEMISEANGALGVIYKQIDIYGNIATVEFLLSDENATVEVAGEVLVPVDGVYTASIDLKEESYLKLKVSNNGQTKEYIKFVAGKYQLVSALDAEAGLELISKNSESTLSINSDKAFVHGDLNASTKLNIKGRFGASSSFTPYFAFNLSSLDVDKIATVAFMVYCDSKSGMEFSVSTFNGSAYVLVSNVKLQYGWNNITIDLSAASLSYDGKVYFRTANLVNNLFAYSVDLYFNDLVILTKES